MANCGDSRITICSSGRSRDISKDHKPYHDAELKRIEAAGGKVVNKRVNGMHGVSRSFGDYFYKQNDALTMENQVVTACPDIFVQERSGNDEFAIIACDGVWDVMNGQEISE